MVSGVERSLFTKSAWAAPAASNSAFTADSGSIFGRNVNYEDIIRAEKADRERKAAKAKARHEKQKSEGPETKRRRRPAEEHDNQRGSESEVEAKKQNKGKTRERPVTRSTPTKEKFLSDGLDTSPKTYRSPRRKAAAKSTVVSLDDDDDGLIMLTPKKSVKASPKTPKGAEVLDGKESEEEDEYLRALKQKARQKARLQRQGSGQTEKRPSTPSARGSSTILENADPRSPSVAHSQHDSRPTSSRSIQDSGASARHTPISEQEDDPEVKILIQSEIPGAKSLIVKRKASQSLKQVKEFWCRKFDLEESVARQVFFTWKGTRLFDSTTMRGIIRGLKKDHHRQQHRPRSLSLSIDDEDGDDGDDGYSSSNAQDPSGGNIMLEATTPEIYEQKLREQERRRQRQQQQQATTSSTDSGQEDQGKEEADEEVQEEDTTPPTRAATRSASETTAATNQRDQGAIVIRLVSRHLEPMQLRVRPHTTMDKIMRGYAAMRKVDEGKTAWLIFDGDRLDRESTVEDVGLEDDDEVEVNIR
ncbi:uncharacterized protein A1O5_06036 [Cladophialophora psammophila CBS 110553]|uniref:Ubiquitin-like domain-containing protein n=1 Tax=Cladophialophora psammophila CBS 110553 TaxID=1182543 RepID=W9WSY2_9EURO|nr:uncharacterized protein A1O5_06036 [Cladophialophora psammophila CBS 110553]EXJ71043.1 hypothetical protein A1O5_06036 [Cladophialophora psammophila CBS 110553]